MLSKLAVRYVAERVGRSEISKGSASTYRYRLYLLCNRLGHLEPDKITRAHIERWLEATGRSAAYKRGLLATTRHFFGWMVKNGHCKKNPCDDIQPPRLPRYAPRALTHAEVGLVLAECTDPRDRLLLLLMVQEGMRRAEVAGLEIGDYDAHRRSMAIRGKGGRGHVTRYVPVSEETARAIAAYLVEHPAGSGPLIRSYQHGGALTPGYYTSRVSTLMRAAGVKQAAYDGKSPHALRHTAALDVLAEAGDLRVVQSMLGHSSLGTTGWYLRGDVEGIREGMGGREYGTRTVFPVVTDGRV